VRGRRLVAALSAYFGCIALLSAGLSMYHGAGQTLVGYGEVLVCIVVASLCFALAWSVFNSTRGA
jgi:hypothetical protein